MKVKRTVKYESELDKNLIQTIKLESGENKIFECIQCGVCSSTCPVSLYMDYTPRRLMAMIRAGFKDEVLQSFTIWLCSSCYSCTVLCPAGIKITDIMYSLKRMAIKEKVYPRRFPIPVLAREIASAIENEGRVSEFWILLKLFLKANPLKLFASIPLGLLLLFKNRLTLRKERVNGREELKNIFKAIKERAQ